MALQAQQPKNEKKNIILWPLFRPNLIWFWQTLNRVVLEYMKAIFKTKKKFEGCDIGEMKKFW